ncbi:MAG: maltose O-acetyltransferase, maltose O-acetyltransferase [Candidatus Levybacteria bacterium]|nr:maltose O-acetyltransferase, maltose O-acetyltransferase [Candidatus Levybacteria bacterium]
MRNYIQEVRYFNCRRNVPVVGKNCVLVNVLLDGAAQITIGDWVFFGHDCMVLTGAHDYNLRGEARQHSAEYKPITIKNGAWIASGSIILGGITIGENAVIGAGSVVTHDVPDNEVWCGNPAKFVKKI